MYRIAFAAVLFAASMGCGAATTTGDPFARRTRSVLTLDEIQAAHGIGWSAYDMISQLRPEYLKSRGSSSVRDITPPTAVVYLDGVRFGDLQSLKQVVGDQIQRIEYIGASDATTRFGTDHVGGAILIKTK